MRPPVQAVVLAFFPWVLLNVTAHTASACSPRARAWLQRRMAELSAVAALGHSYSVWSVMAVAASSEAAAPGAPFAGCLARALADALFFTMLPVSCLCTPRHACSL